MNNDISEGIPDFNYPIEKLVLTKKDNRIFFKYYKKNIEYYQIKSEIPFIDLSYLLEEKNKNEVLQNMSFKGIKILEIYEFDDLKFLSNESLSELKILKSDMNDITIFNKIKFINIDEIKFNNIINKGFSSLNIFKSIKINKIEVNETYNYNYICKLESESPKINNSFSFDDLNFLKEQILSDTKNVIIAQNILDNKQNWNFFSFNELKNSFPIFKNLKHENIIINYNNDNKYICTTKLNDRLKFYLFLMI